MASETREQPAAPVCFESRAIAIRRRRIARALGWSVLVCFALWFVLLATPGAGAAAWLSGWSIVVSAVAWLVTRAWSAVDVRRGNVEVRPGELVVRRGSTTREVPLDSIVEGWVNPRRDAVTLKLRGGDEVRVLAETTARGQELLAAAGVDPSRRTMRQRLGETAFWDIMTWLLGPIAVLPASIALANTVAEWFGRVPGNVQAVVGLATFGVLFTLLFWTVRELLGPAHLTVGSDGIVVRQRFGRRFVPFEALENGAASVEVGPQEVVLRARDGAVRAKARHLTEDEKRQLEDRIAHAIEVWQAGGDHAAALAQLDRGARTVSAWREALADLLREREDYRRAALSREQVEAALEDASAVPERRIGAALALASGGEPARARVRVASEACANPKLRVALEAIACGARDDAALEAAMEGEDQKERRRPIRPVARPRRSR